MAISPEKLQFRSLQILPSTELKTVIAVRSFPQQAESVAVAEVEEVAVRVAEAAVVEEEVVAKAGIKAPENNF
jgi:hypothetical protein